MFETLTAFIPDLEKGGFAGCTEQSGNGTPEKLPELCRVEYSDSVHKLVDALFAFRKEHGEDMKLDYYPALIHEIGDRWQGENPADIDVSVLDGRLIVGFLLVEISMSRFDGSGFLDLCKAGTVLRCLKRLKEIDENGGEAPYPVPVRDLVRGETDPEYIMQGEEDILDVDYDGEYTVQLEDLLAGIRNMRRNPRVAEQWVDELMFCDDDIWPAEEEDERSGRLFTEEGAVLCARKVLNDLRFGKDEVAGSNPAISSRTPEDVVSMAPGVFLLPF